MRRFGVKAEIFEDRIEYGLVIEERVERILHFLARSLVCDQVDLERCHLALRKER